MGKQTQVGLVYRVLGGVVLHWVTKIDSLVKRMR